MDGAYLVMLFVTLEQESSIKTLFKENGWLYRGKEFSSCTMESARDVIQSNTTGTERSVGNPGAGEFYTMFVALLKEFLVSLEYCQSNVSFSKSDESSKVEQNKIHKVSRAKRPSGNNKLKAPSSSKSSHISKRSKNKDKIHELKQACSKVSTVLHNSEAYSARAKPSKIQFATVNRKRKRIPKLTKSNIFDVLIKTENERNEEHSEQPLMEPFSLEQRGVDQNEMESYLNADDFHDTFVSDSDFTDMPCIPSSSSCVERDSLDADLENGNKDEVDQSSIKFNSKEGKSNRGKINKRQSKVHNRKVRDSIQDDTKMETVSLNIESDVNIMNQTKKLSKKGKYDCSECERTFMFLSKYQNHKRDGKCKFDCSFCGKTFTSRNWSTYQAHLRWHKNERPFRCNQCDKSYKFVTNLNDHKRTHSGERPFICDFCGSSFTKSLLMRAHIKRKHLEQKCLHCDKCNSLFSNEADLKQHLKYTHSTARPFECHICHKTYKTKPTLNIHLLTHNEERGFTCDICDKSFKLRGTLRCHMIRHKKQYSVYCDICGKGCYDNKKLKEHKRTHSGEKPFACSVCNYRCAIAGNLKKHMKVHEKDASAITSIVAQNIATSAVVCRTYMSNNYSEIPSSRNQTVFTTPQSADSRHMITEKSADDLSDRTTVVKDSHAGYINTFVKVGSNGTELQSPELQDLDENVKTLKYDQCNTGDVGNFTQIHENGVTYIHDAETGVTYAHVTNQEAKLGQVLSGVRSFHAPTEDAGFTYHPSGAENYEQNLMTQYDHDANHVYQTF
ncbi:hypothetical protein ACJMK2_005024 [Sinanodonta woodiana]|uniref:C2H2-type domain-containing protein n=1 Tax=Sinanodonta woodiana TaxID=1069815 RepID=A0ABD3VNW7_SINWO